MMKKALLDYDEIRRMLDEKYRATKRLICNGVTRLDSLAEGFAEADQVIWKLFFDADKPQTNADRIRKMNDDWLKNVILCPLEFSGLVECPDVPNCTTCKQYWLQQPAEVE